MLATAPPSEATTIFKEQWQAYQAVTKGGHLKHEELFAPLRTLLNQRYPKQAIRLVDLGCGQGNALQLLSEPGSPNSVDLSSYMGEWPPKVLSCAELTLHNFQFHTLLAQASICQQPLFRWLSRRPFLLCCLLAPSTNLLSRT